MVARGSAGETMARRCGALVLAAAIAAVFLALAASSASATYGPFCPPDNSRSIYLTPYQSGNNWDRCAHVFHNNVGIVSYYNSVGHSVCAVLKAGSTGGGANVGGLDAACVDDGRAGASQYPIGHNGYATGINRSGWGSSGFYGYMQYGV